MQPRAEVALCGEERGGVLDDRLEDHDAGRKIRRRDDARAGVRRGAANGRLVLLPPGRAHDDVDAATDERRKVDRDRRRRGEVDGDVDRFPAVRNDAVAPGRGAAVDRAGDFAAVFGRQTFDEPPHATVADQQYSQEPIRARFAFRCSRG